MCCQTPSTQERPFCLCHFHVQIYRELSAIRVSERIDERGGLMRLARRQFKVQRVTLTIANQMDFRGKTSARPA